MNLCKDISILDFINQLKMDAPLIDIQLDPDDTLLFESTLKDLNDTRKENKKDFLNQLNDNHKNKKYNKPTKVDYKYLYALNEKRTRHWISRDLHFQQMYGMNPSILPPHRIPGMCSRCHRNIKEVAAHRSMVMHWSKYASQKQQLLWLSGNQFLAQPNQLPVEQKDLLSSHSTIIPIHKTNASSMTTSSLTSSTKSPLPSQSLPNILKNPSLIYNLPLSLTEKYDQGISKSPNSLNFLIHTDPQKWTCIKKMMHSKDMMLQETRFNDIVHILKSPFIDLCMKFLIKCLK